MIVDYNYTVHVRSNSYTAVYYIISSAPARERPMADWDEG